ncbi:MAG: insulinase family protein [Verrucomicrobia bacterium]|nr:insulinase family protein [Verrucomicrobiota bacterium]
MKNLIATCFVISTIFTAAATPPQPLPSMSAPASPTSSTNTNATSALTVSGNPQVFTLKNGLTVIVEEDHHAPVASVQAWCCTGSIDENKWLGAGLSHILEHMLFKGTATRPPGKIAEEIQAQGGYLNAYTSFDRTVFWTDIPAAGVSKAVDVFADAVMNASLPPDEYVKEQEVIRREFAMGDDDPDRKSSELLFSTAFQVSPYRHPIIGYRAVYDQLTREDVMEYFKKRYVPNNLCFVIVGDVDAAAVHQQLDSFFEKYPRKALEPVLVEKEPPQLGMKVARKTFPTELSRVNLAWKAPGVTDPKAPALEVLGNILGSGNSSILNQEVREKKQLVFQVGGGFYGLNASEGLLFVNAVVDPKKREAAEAEILAQINNVAEHGVTQQELEKAKKSLLSDHLCTLTTVHGRAQDYGSNWLETGNPTFGKEYLNAIQRVTVEEVNQAAKQFLVQDHLTITSLDPENKPPKDDQKKEMTKKMDQREVKKVVLPNGLRLLICEDHRLPLISMMGVFRGGLLAENAKNNGVTDLLASTLVKGTKNRSAQNIADTIEQVGGSIGANAGNNSFSVSVGVMKPDFALGLNLLAEVLTEATFPAEEIEHEKMAQLAAIQAEDDQMLSMTQRLLKEKLYGTHPYSRRILGTKETVPGLNREMVEEFYKKYAVGKNGVIAIFGDINAEEATKLAAQAFEKMPAGELALQNPPEPQPLTKTIDVSKNENKEQAIVVKGFLTAPITSPDRPALELIDAACSDLGSRFFLRIREKQSLAYFVGASSSMGLAPGAFVFYMGTDPKKLDHAKSEFDDEIQHVAKDGLTQEELRTAKQKILGADAMAIQSNAGLMLRCASEELMGLGFDHYLQRINEVNDVTLEKLNAVVKKYIAVPGSVEAVVAPKGATTGDRL